MMKKTILLLSLLLMLGSLAYGQPTVTSFDFSGPYINCQVPQINGMTNKDLQNTVNTFLLNQIQPDLTSFQKTVADMQANTQIDPPWGNNYQFESKYTIKFQRSFLLSVTQQEYWFSGGAHGMALLRAANINLETGQIYSLEQIFKPDSNWQALLDSLISKQIAASQYGDGYSFKTITHFDQFYFLEEGLVVYFQPYEIGPWAIGTPRFVLSWADIGDHLQHDLPLY